MRGPSPLAVGCGLFAVVLPLTCSVSWGLLYAWSTFDPASGLSGFLAGISFAFGWLALSAFSLVCGAIMATAFHSGYRNPPPFASGFLALSGLAAAAACWLFIKGTSEVTAAAIALASVITTIVIWIVALHYAYDKWGDADRGDTRG